MPSFGVISRAVPIVVVALAVLTGWVSGQTPARTEFEVASIKLNTSCGNGRVGGGGPAPGRLSLQCISVRGMIRAAYASFGSGGTLNPSRLEVAGGPAWLDSDLYDLEAKAASAAPLSQTAGPMLQALLEDRCKLKVHREAREAPVYSLTVAKSGAKLQASKEGSCTPIDIDHMATRPAPGQPQPHYCGTGGARTNGTTSTADWYGLSMAEFAGRMLQGQVDRPVIDKTGLTGRFDIHLEFTRDASSGPVTLNGVVTPGEPAPFADGAGPSIFTAIQEQLGLKLSPDKGPVEVLVIDQVERPSEN